MQPKQTKSNKTQKTLERAKLVGKTMTLVDMQFI